MTKNTEETTLNQRVTGVLKNLGLEYGLASDEASNRKSRGLFGSLLELHLSGDISSSIKYDVKLPRKKGILGIEIKTMSREEVATKINQTLYFEKNAPYLGRLAPKVNRNNRVVYTECAPKNLHPSLGFLDAVELSFN